MNTIDYRDSTRVKPTTRVSMCVNAYIRVIFVHVKRVSYAISVELVAGLYCTWKLQISYIILGHARQQAGQLYLPFLIYTARYVYVLYTNLGFVQHWNMVRNIFILGLLVYTHLRRLDALQSRIEQTCSFTFQPLSHRRGATIVGLVCHLLAGESHGNLLNYCPQFCGNQTHHRSHRFHSWDPAEHLRLVDSCNFKTP